MAANPRAGFLSACLLFSFALIVSACHKDPATPPVNKPLEMPANSGPVLDASNDFAINIFREMLKLDAASSNKLISPLSIYTCLGMAYNGAAGSTKDAMTKTLSLNGIPTPQLNAVTKALIEQMPHEDSKVQLSIANSIWYDQHRATPIPTFLDTVRNNFQAVLQALDFSQSSSVKTINSWVAQHTNNKIPEIIDQLDPSEVMVLVNAVYFNGAWKYAFKSNDTRNDVFRRADGTTVSVPFMNQTTTLRAYHNQTFDLVELPYGTGNAFNMYLLLPAQLPNGTPAPLNSFAASFDRPALTAALSHLDSMNIQLSLPKWEYSYNIDDMTPHLSDLGMGIAFGPQADFTKMYPPSAGAAISQIIHKTYIKVNEEGTEAAAVTAVGFSITSATGPTALPVKFDHPFFYLITEKQTGSIFFMGLVNDPSPSR